MPLDTTDKALLDLLHRDGRATTSALARELGISRSTVKDRIARLERRGIIRGYRVELGEDYAAQQITAHVMINVNPKYSQTVVKDLSKMHSLHALHTINGNHDLLAIVKTDSTQALDKTLDDMGNLDGIDRTESSIVLSTKFER